MNFKKFFLKSDFSKNVLTLMTGTALAQALPILISPILTRLYSDKDFGLFSLYSSIVMGILTIGSLRYNMAIVLPKKDEEAKQLVKLSRKIILVVSIVATFFLVYFSNTIVKQINGSGIEKYFFIAGISIFVLAQIEVIRYYLNRKKKYKLISKAKVYQSGGSSFFQVLFGVFPMSGGVTGMIFGVLVGQTMGLYYLFKRTKNEFNAVADNDKFLLNKYKKMPLLNGPNAVVDAIRVNGINIMIARLFSSMFLGQFALAWRVLQSPLGLINGALSQVCFQRLSVLEKHEHYSFLRKSVLRSFLLGVIPFTVLYFFAPIIFSFIFGESWRVAGKVASYLSPWLFLNLITSPISTFFIVVEKQGLLLLYAVFYMLVPFIVIWEYRADFLLAIQGLSISMSIMLLIFIAMVLITSKNNQKPVYDK